MQGSSKMEMYEISNGATSLQQENETNTSYTSVHFLIGDRKEVAFFRPDQVTSCEIKELFRSAAEAGPLDIVKLRKADKILSISCNLPRNSSDDPYILQVVGVYPETSRMIETDLLRTLVTRVVAVEQQFHDQQEDLAATPCLILHELKKQVNSFRKKLETTEHLSWLGFYKQLPEPITSTACRNLIYRRKSDTAKQKVQEKFLQMRDISLVPHAREWMRSPTFDAGQWEDEELLLMLQAMFIELELPQKFNIALSTLHNFIFEVYNNYNEVPFHNFRHCFCVAQMMYTIVWAVDLISKIGELEVLVLLVSCICHDLDHPGYNNIYQINARTELALRYNDISPLENHHCSVAFRVLEAPDCNILASFDFATYRTVREGIIRCILATDMARHNEILAQFTDAVSDFDFTSKVHINLLSMVLIKVADISNEARPMDVAEPWLDSLLQEFFKQSDAEKLEGLPVTPFMDRDKITKPSSQCSFIGLVLLPLFEVLGELFPELQELIIEPVRYALDYYRRLNEAAKDERQQRKSLAELSEHATVSRVTVSSNGSVTSPESQEQLSKLISRSSAHSLNNVAQQQHQCSHHEQQLRAIVGKSMSTHSMRSRCSISTLHLCSRSIEDEVCGEGYVIPLSGTEVADLSSSDPETATEVEVSEKALKFKISTEGTVGPGRKSYPGSRKGSREKSSLDYHNYDITKAVYEQERRRSRSENLYSELTLPQNVRSSEETRILEELELDEQHHVKLLFPGSQTSESDHKICSLEKTTQHHRNLGITKGNHSCDNTTLNSNHCLLSNLMNSSADQIIHGKQTILGYTEKKKMEHIDAISRRYSSRCCCQDKHGTYHHKSFLSRLRNFTDRLSISFDSKDTQGLPKSTKCSKSLSKSLSISATSSSLHQQNMNDTAIMCKKCNLSKFDEQQLEKRPMTLPKVKHLQNNKQKSWRTVFAKEKRPSVSLEILPAGNTLDNMENIVKHRRNFSNPEGENTIEIESLSAEPLASISFKEIDFRPTKPEIFVDRLNSGSSTAVDRIGITEIRRSSASMEDISKIAKQSEMNLGLLDCPLEQQTCKPHEAQQHTGSLDSILYRGTRDAHMQSASSTVAGSRHSTNFTKSSPTHPKKSLPGLFLRFKSGMSVDGTRNSSTSGFLHDYQHQGWISSLTSSFRPKRQVYEHQELPLQPCSSPTPEEVK